LTGVAVIPVAVAGGDSGAGGSAANTIEEKPAISNNAFSLDMALPMV